MATTVPFQGHTQFHAFPNQQGTYTGEYGEVCRSHGHPPLLFPILPKYSKVTNLVFCSFCGSSTHGTEQCRALDALADRLDRTAFRVNDNARGRGGGGYRGGINGGRGPVRCYNCDDQGYVTRECPLPKRPWCSHCRVNAHTTEDCPELIAKWEERIRQRGANIIS